MYMSEYCIIYILKANHNLLADIKKIGQYIIFTYHPFNVKQHIVLMEQQWQ